MSAYESVFTEAIRSGDVVGVRALLAEHPELATVRFGSAEQSRTALHIATDWPGHYPNVAAVIELLVELGADVEARFVGSHRETALHWAASSDDVEALDALIRCGAQLDTDGGVLTDGSALDDAVIFGQLNAARRLVEAGATTKLFHAAALGLEQRVQELLSEGRGPDEVTNALWHACHAGQLGTARQLLAAGGDPHWVGHLDHTPAQEAHLSGNPQLAALFP